MAFFREKIENTLRPHIEAFGAYLIEVSSRSEKNEKVVEIFVDTDEGINAEKCAEISRSISQILDGLEEFQSKYNLIVSSPGIERPLMFHGQYRRNIGRKMSVKTSRINDRRIEGELLEVRSDSIIIKIEGGKSNEISFSEISEAYILPRW